MYLQYIYSRVGQFDSFADCSRASSGPNRALRGRKSGSTSSKAPISTPISSSLEPGNLIYRLGGATKIKVPNPSPKTFKLNMQNQRLLNKFIPAVKKLTTHGYLLSNRKGEKMSKQVLSKTLMRITKDRIGKSFSTQLLRILYAMRNRDVIESAKEVSEKLMHSQEQTLQYAKK